MSRWIAHEKNLLAEFRHLKRDLAVWGGVVDAKIVELLTHSAQFNYGHVKIDPKHRIKDEQSFIRKALYRGKGYATPLKEIEDKVGTRVVLLLNKQVYEVKELIEACPLWHCTVGKDIYEQQQKFPRQFDYQAVHLVVKPLEGNGNFAAGILDKLTCEIQIKTLFQHAYSEVSHDTVYKGPFRNENSLIRALSKTMALLEVADDNFGAMFDKVNSSDLWSINFMREVNAIYRRFRPRFDEGTVDSYLADSVMSMVNIIGHIDIDRLDDFVQQNKKDIEKIVADEEFYLSSQPVVVLLAYMVVNHTKTLTNNWDFNQEILEELYTRMGYAPEDVHN